MSLFGLYSVDSLAEDDEFSEIFELLFLQESPLAAQSEVVDEFCLLHLDFVF